MKNIDVKFPLIGALATVLLFACADSAKKPEPLPTFPGTAANAAVGAKKKTYEFKIQFFDDGTAVSKLNSLGSSGWTVVGSRRASSTSEKYGYECILQREK